MTALNQNGAPYSATVSTFLQNLKQDISSEPRMLTESEAKCLRQQKQEIHHYVRQRMIREGKV